MSTSVFRHLTAFGLRRLTDSGLRHLTDFGVGRLTASGLGYLTDVPASDILTDSGFGIRWSYVPRFSFFFHCSGDRPYTPLNALEK